MKKNVTSQNFSYDKVEGMKGGRNGRGLMRGVERERVVSGGEGIFGGGVGGLGERKRSGG